MTTSVAAVVPTRNSARTLGRCLDSILGQTAPADEVLVVDNGSTDGTAELALARGVTLLRHGRERSAQRNHGWRATRSDAVIFVDSDMVLTPDVLEQARRALAAADVAALVVPELAFGDGFLAGCRALEKELYLGNAAVEAARVFRRDALVAVGGYDETLTACEDWDLADRVAAQVGRIGRVDALVWHDEGRLALASSFAKKRYYGRWVARYVTTRTDQVQVRPVRRLGRREARLLARSPLRAAGLGALKAFEVAGFAAGMVDARRGRPA